MLISEIECFISRLEVGTVMREDLVFEGKDKDDKRFPDYDKILTYVISKEAQRYRRCFYDKKGF